MSSDTERPDASLPKSGLAEDILKSVQTESATTAVNEPRHEGIDQLFTFTDTLARDGGDDRRKEEQLETWVFFTAASECYGLPVSHVQEILRVAGITRVPHAPPIVRGVTNMRGKVLPVVDLSMRLGFKEAALQKHSRILVVGSRGRTLGLLVDSVDQVARIAPSQIQPPPPDIMTAQSDYIVGVYHLPDQMAVMLSVDKVLLIRDIRK